MILTKQQAYLLDLVRTFRCLRLRQAQWFMRTAFRYTAVRVRQCVQWMCREELLALVDGDCVILPFQPYEKALLPDIDVMIRLCRSTLPEFVRGRPPFSLCFCLPESGCLYRIVPLIPGRERFILVQLEAHRLSPADTIILRAESMEQIPECWQRSPNCLVVLPDAEDGYSFWKGGDTEN